MDYLQTEKFLELLERLVVALEGEKKTKIVDTPVGLVEVEDDG